MSSYSVLGIAPNATDDEVRLAYKHKVGLILALGCSLTVFARPWSAIPIGISMRRTLQRGTLLK